MDKEDLCEPNEPTNSFAQLCFHKEKDKRQKTQKQNKNKKDEEEEDSKC